MTRAGLGPVLDNVEGRSVGEALRVALSSPGAIARVVSAYFSIYGYGELRSELEQLSEFLFLFGDPSSIEDVDPGNKADKVFVVGEDGAVALESALQQKFLAVACRKWVERENVKIRTITKSNFVHGKMYHVCPQLDRQSPLTIIGSSNFTKRGLGFARNSNIEINVSLEGTETRDCQNWFDNLWHSNLTQDAKEDVIRALGRIGKDYAPEQIYFKTLLEIFRDDLDAGTELNAQLEASGLLDSTIWSKLYLFQKEAVPGIINRLKKYNGCILADSVGLGKTYTTLAVIKYFESRNERVLVLCPKRLRENWALYPSHLNHRKNPLLKDRFGFTLLSHSDLSRTSGMSGDVDLTSFNWENYDLVVIDESHNFRNASKSTRDESGNIVHTSRYDKLLNHVIKKGGKTKVLMLSATPVNTSLRDLRNQIYLMTENRTETFRDALGISDVGTLLASAQKQFLHWARETTPSSEPKSRAKLVEALGGEFFSLLDAVSIARSRRMIKKYYSKTIEQFGGFPARAKPENHQPSIDIKGELSFEHLCQLIDQLSFAMYQPATYLREGTPAYAELGEEKKKLNFNQKDRETWLAGMIRTNFFKRLESSPRAFELTLTRIIEILDDLITKVEHNLVAEGESRKEDLPGVRYDDDEDDDLVIGKNRHPYKFQDLYLEKWIKNLRADREVLDKARGLVAKVTPDRDGKLKALVEIIQKLVRSPAEDKDGRANRKVLIFSAFKDTAAHLYQILKPKFTIQGVHMGMVSGSETHATLGKNDYHEILANFAPIGCGGSRADTDDTVSPDVRNEIDILIATDCVSEGQNLQDCRIVVNYDIHWNPVRVVQRFGRIDRIGSRNHNVQMINFWPPVDLDRYLNLARRVDARMALLNLAATGDENLFRVAGGDEQDGQLELDLDFRDKQIERLKYEVLDLEEVGEGVSISDFTLDEFFSQLLAYLSANRESIERIPDGVCGVVNAESEPVRPDRKSGAIFVLRQKNSSATNPVNPRHPLYLAYVQENQTVYWSFPNLKQMLLQFSGLTRGMREPIQDACDSFARDTQYGKDMSKYTKLVECVVQDIIARSRAGSVQHLLSGPGAHLPKKSDRPNSVTDFALVTWLVLQERGHNGPS